MKYTSARVLETARELSKSKIRSTWAHNAMPLSTVVVTPSLNQASFIERAIRSVIHQHVADLEHVVVDGGSTDGTVEILRSHGDRIGWSSEADAGQAQAVNKG